MRLWENLRIGLLVVACFVVMAAVIGSVVVTLMVPHWFPHWTPWPHGAGILGVMVAARLAIVALD